MEKPGGKLKIVTFSKCSCCSDCYFFFTDNSLAICIIPVYSKAGAYFLLESCKLDGSINEHDFQFFKGQIAASMLPERTEVLGPLQQREHFRKPEVLKNIQETAKFLIKESLGRQGAQD